MGKIQSNVGLITGIPITDTVDQLIGVAGQSRDLLSTRNQGLQQEQVAVNSLSTRILSLKFDLAKLKVSTPFLTRSVSSAKEDVLTATLASDGKPPLGSFSLRTAQTASSQQLISQRFESLDDIESIGSLDFGFGGFVNKGISLDALNNGSGVERGEIKITDLAGNSAILDLSLARTVDDVLEAINNESSLNVTASTDGDTIVLTDLVGGASTLTVQEVNGGTTAAGLGLAAISTTSASATGADVFGLHGKTKLASLNDSNGVRYTDDTKSVDGEDFALDDLLFTLADETLNEDDTKIGVDLTGATTLSDVVDAINNDIDLTGKVSAAISADGNRLKLTDLTAGAGTFTVTNGTTGSAADDLGLITTEVGGVITGNRLVSGLRDTLVSSLNGGQGVALGSIVIFDRNGDDDTISLSSAETLSDITKAINASSVNVTASINSAGNGISITDNTGGNDNLQITNADANNTADALGITVDAAQVSVDSGSLNRQSLSKATLLSTLNGGEGIEANDIRITDSKGKQTSIDLNASGNEAKTIGDVIDAIKAKFNAGDIGVEARINDAGDGILITDTALGSETLLIEDVNGTLAKDLNLTRTSKTIDIEGVDTQVVDGTQRFNIDLADLESTSSSISLASLNDGAGISAGDIRITDSDGGITSLDLNGTDADIKTIGELIEAINSRDAQVTASINSAGTGIELTDTAGGDGNLVVIDVNGSAASDLKILSTEKTTDTISGFGLFESQSASQGALRSVAEQINNLESGVTASVLNDGVGFRLQLVVDKTGAENEILLDTGSSGFEFRETSSARDGLLIVGAGDTAGSGVLVSSSTNDFSDVISGVDLTAVSKSDTAVEVNVTKSSDELVDLVKSFVDSYNTLRGDLDNLTDFDEDSQSTGLLFGTNEALRVDTELSRLITNRYTGLGSFESLQEIGISVDEKGKLELDSKKLKDAFDKDSQSLQTLFTASDRGIVAKFETAIEGLTGSENGLLTRRNDSLRVTIESNAARIERFNESLERQRERLLLQFFQLEQVIAGLQTSQSAVNSFQSVPPLSISSS